MQGMSLSVNAVSEVREFTTTTGRTVYVLDGRADFDLDALIAACNSKACAPPPVGTGGSLSSSKGFSTKSGANPDARVKELTSDASSPFYQNFVRPEILEQDKIWDLRMPKNPAVRIRVPSYITHDIAESGVFKNQHDSGSSMGFFDPQYRADFEKVMFGEGLKTHPIYGYIAERGSTTRFDEAPVMYGDVVFELKPQVNNRTTIVLGDSLSQRVAPIPLNDVRNVSPERRAMAKTGLPMYLEAQIHDPLDLRDVERIYTRDIEPDPVISDIDRIDRLRKRFPNIEVVVVPAEEFANFSAFSSDEACAVHGEFACTSKECAPPPVGRGGSLPTRLSRGVQVEVPVGRLWDALVLGARGDKSALVDLFSEYVMAGHVPYYTPTRKAGRSWSTSDATAKRFAWDKVYDGSMVGESNGRHVARKVGRTWTIRIPLVLRGRPEIGKSDDWTDASSRDLNWWAEQEGEVRISKDAKIKLDNVSVALPSRKQLERILAMDNPREIIDIFGGEDTSPWVDLDMPLVLTASVCVEHGEFACKSKACAPPPVGTGGSLPTAVQHVTSREAAALIKSGGFLVGRGEMHGSLFGNGIYLSMAGDRQASELYRKGTKAEGHAPALVRATVRLKRSLKVSGDTRDEVFDDMVEKLGGRQGVIDAATKSYERLRDGAKTALKGVLGEDAVERVDWNGEFETDPVFNDMTSRQYADFVAAVEPYLPHGLASFGDLSGVSTLRKVMAGKAASSSWSRAVSNLVADLGYDGIEITNPSFSAAVGGSQIVVFDPKAITVESVEDFGALIERFGIEVALDYAPEVFACTEHGEFACTSKACAPPPVGTGGSLKSGSGAVERWTGGEATVNVAPKSARFISTDMITERWPRTPEDVMKLLGNSEPYPDDFKVSDAQAASLNKVADMWISTGSIAVSKFRKIAADAIEDGIDRVASGDSAGRTDNLSWRSMVARVLTVVRSAPRTTVWRGLRVSQEVLDQWKIGGVYSEVLATATGRETLAKNFARGKFGSVGDKKSGATKVLLKMTARNVPIGGSEKGNLVALADERFVSGDFLIKSITKERGMTIIEVEQIDGD